MIDAKDLWRLGFPFFSIEEFSILFLGSFQFKMAHSYISNIREGEVRKELADNENVNITWDEYDAKCEELPDNLIAFYFYQVDEPTNWIPELMGEWCARYVVTIEIPSAHTVEVHKVVISFVTCDDDLPEGFQNRLGKLFNDRPNMRRLLGYACVGKDCKPGICM